MNKNFILVKKRYFIIILIVICFIGYKICLFIDYEDKKNLYNHNDDIKMRKILHAAQISNQRDLYKLYLNYFSDEFSNIYQFIAFVRVISPKEQERIQFNQAIGLANSLKGKRPLTYEEFCKINDYILFYNNDNIIVRNKYSNREVSGKIIDNQK